MPGVNNEWEGKIYIINWRKVSEVPILCKSLDRFWRSALEGSF